MISLRSDLKLISSFRFPVQDAAARKDLLIGALWLLVPFLGWILNMGHRIQFVHHMIHDEVPFPSWKNYKQLFRNGLVTFAGMLFYNIPTAVFIALYFHLGSAFWGIAAIASFAAASVAIPGFMSHYCVNFDPSEIFNPFKALARCLQIGPDYWRAWFIAICALLVSFFGLIFLGVGFLVTSVWFWQVAGFSFATAFARRYQLFEKD